MWASHCRKANVSDEFSARRMKRAMRFISNTLSTHVLNALSASRFRYRLASTCSRLRAS